MTRINLVPVTELTNKHLLAEYREITRIPSYLKKAKNTEVPSRYTMGAGHVRFFYNKGLFLFNRTQALYTECVNRGFKVSYKVYNIEAHNTNQRLDFTPANDEIEINRGRINERLNKV